MNKITQFQSNN